MKVIVKSFANIRDVLGTGELLLEVAAGTTIGLAVIVISVIEYALAALAAAAGLEIDFGLVYKHCLTSDCDINSSI